MDNNNTNVILVSASEQADIIRAVLTWLNSYENKPWKKVDYEYLGKTSGLCVSTVTAAFKTKQYITGGYKAQYQFQIVYRLIADDVDARIGADEALNAMGEWCETDRTLALPLGFYNAHVKRDTSASMVARYDNNADDHAISLTLTYEVI